MVPQSPKLAQKSTPQQNPLLPYAVVGDGMTRRGEGRKAARCTIPVIVGSVLQLPGLNVALGGKVVLSDFIIFCC
jgi:hypothetical protein